MKKNSMSPLIDKYYKSWISRNSHFGHPNDDEAFLKFVKAYTKYGKKRRNGGWLRTFLEKDLDNYTEDYKSEIIEKAVSIFDYIVDYHYIIIPDHLIEMKNPYLVEGELRRVIDKDGNRYYSDESIKKYLIENFGKYWQNKKKADWPW